ncbi:MAG: DNA polymerase IV [Caulobacteraceae bacterium]
MPSLCRDCLWTSDADAARCPNCYSPRLARHPELFQLSIAHMDCDAFYASVEKRDAPELRDLPVIVGGGVRGVVTTCCYIARLSGVRSAMPMFKATKLCPEAVIIKPNFTKYRTESRRIMAKVRDLTPLVQPLSLDEAWIDLSGTERLHGAPPALVLARLQKEIEADIGISVSIGLAPNKFLAKIASDLDKPRGFSVIGAKGVAEFLAPKPVGILPGVGPAMVKSLAARGFHTVGDLTRAEPRAMADQFGEHGLRLQGLAQGRDTRRVNPNEDRKSISAETTFNSDIKDREALEDILWPLAERVARQARTDSVVGRVVTLKLRQTDFKIITRRRTLPLATQTAKTLFQAAKELLRTESDGRFFRLIGVGLSDLSESADSPGDFFAADESRALHSERAIDALRARFGDKAVVSGRTLKP